MRKSLTNAIVKELDNCSLDMLRAIYWTIKSLTKDNKHNITIKNNITTK